jgi:hypothetical protein
MSVPGRVVDLVEQERIITQNQIDRLAHELYGLNHEEIEIVEQESRQGG